MIGSPPPVCQNVLSDPLVTKMKVVGSSPNRSTSIE